MVNTQLQIPIYTLNYDYLRALNFTAILNPHSTRLQKKIFKLKRPLFIVSYFPLNPLLINL